MRHLFAPAAIVFLLSAFLETGFAGELRLDARTLYQRGVSQNLALTADGSALELEQGELFEDDGPAAGFSYKPNEEKLSATTWIKKELLIPNPRAKKATLLVGPGGALQAIVNGQSQTLRKVGKAGSYWEAYLLSPESLREGKNEIVLHGSGRIWIARAEDYAAGSRVRTQHPNRSARSLDGGKTWDYDHLGAGGNVDGEYYVRLFLEHYRPRGALTLPVLDAGNLPGDAVASPLAALGPFAIRLTTGGAGKITTRVRSGATPVPGKEWSAWQDSGTLAEPRGRYLQVALEFAASDPLQTPQLKEVIIEASPKRADDWLKDLRTIDSHNETIVRTALPFEYEPFDHPRLKALRTKYQLDAVVKDAKGELDMMSRLATWSARQWERGHLKDLYPAWDALDILRPHTDGTPVGGFCQQYNLVLLQACASFGLPGRAVSIGPGAFDDRLRGGGHEVAEIWSNEHKKWIYIDGNTAWYAVDAASKTPLSLWELRQRQLQTLRKEATPPIEVVALAPTRHEWKGLDSWPPFVELRLIPRSNFLHEKSPLPLNQGMRGWFWTGHYVWSDAGASAGLLYGHRVSSPGTWNWTLNQAHFVLEAARPGELRVHLDTETPGFDTFLADIDGKGPQPVSSGFLWKLHPGQNRLEVRPRNRAGRAGIASRVVVKYQ